MPEGWQEERTVQDTCPVLALPATVEAWRGCLSPRLRKNLRYAWRRLAKLGAVSVARASQENLHELFASLLHLHSARWSWRGSLGVLAPAGVQKAHQETVPGLFALGLLRLYSLRLADRMVASFYGFTHTAAGKKRAYFYLSGFDPALAVGVKVRQDSGSAAARQPRHKQGIQIIRGGNAHWKHLAYSCAWLDIDVERRQPHQTPCTA